MASSAADISDPHRRRVESEPQRWSRDSVAIAVAGPRLGIVAQNVVPVSRITGGAPMLITTCQAMLVAIGPEQHAEFDRLQRRAAW